MSTTVSEVANREAGEVIAKMQGKIVKAYELKSGENEKGEWSIQDGYFKDSTGEIKIAFFNHEDVRPLLNKEITLGAHKGAKGLSGVYAHDNNYQGKTTREVKITETGKIELVGEEKQEPKPKEKIVGTTHVELEDSVQILRHELMRCCNALYLIERAITVESDQSEINGFTSTDEHKRAKCATAFIHLDRMGLVSKLPDKPVWSATSVVKKGEPQKKFEAMVEKVNEEGVAGNAGDDW